MLSNGKIYQDLWINGRVVLQSGLYDKKGNKKTAGPECDMRYRMLKRLLPKAGKMYVVDVGACYGYFGIRIAQDFLDAQILLIENQELDLLHMMPKWNNVDDRVVVEPSLEYWLEAGLTPKELEKRTTVLLLLNVLHHLGEWEEVLDKAHDYDYLIIQHPYDDDVDTEHMERVGVINEALKEEFALKLVGEFESHRTNGVKRPMYLGTKKGNGNEVVASRAEKGNV